MTSSIPQECLEMIFEFIDRQFLLSCLLVNRFWCNISVRILWRTILNYKTFYACLPNESKLLLQENGIIIPTPTSRPLLFNYVEFIKKLKEMTIILGHSKILPNYPINKRALIVQETFKMIMKHASLKEIDIKTTFSFLTINVPYITFPGANLCFQNLCKFVGDSSTNSEFCSRLADICKDIKKFKMEIAEDINEGMKKFISVQRNIKEFDILLHNNRCTNIVPTLMNIADTLIKLNFEGLMFCPNMTFISKFINLRELSIILSYDHENLSALQYVTLPQLKRLSLKGAGIPRDYLSRFLENHGRNLDKLTCDNTLNSVIINYCPKLNFLCTSFYEETELRFLLKNCEKLTTLEVDCYQSSLNESRVLASVAEVGASTLAELRINKNTIQRDAQIFSDLSEDINWGERIAPISIILNVEEGSRTSDQGRLMIEKYISLDKIKSYEEISLPMYDL